jgi:drug/metabolite transporter (DMT)-like permease
LSLYLGQLAALATSFLYSANSILFTQAGKKTGSTILNRLRILFALVYLTLAHFLFRIPLPLNAGASRTFWLSLSGIIGLSLGDAFLFEAILWVGPRLAMLMMSLAPVISAVAAWIFFGEHISVGQIGGIVLTLGGIALVVTERAEASPPPDGRSPQEHATHERRRYVIGLLLALGAASGQAFGLIAAKMGLGGDFPAISATWIRMLAAALVIWGLTLVRRETGATVRQFLNNRRTALYIMTGALAGPFLGVTFTLYAIQRIPVGVASTLTALPPIILLPVGYYLYKERFGWRSLLGTGAAMLGVALLFLV